MQRLAPNFGARRASRFGHRHPGVCRAASRGSASGRSASGPTGGRACRPGVGAAPAHVARAADAALYPARERRRSDDSGGASALFGAEWRSVEAKIVEVPALHAPPARVQDHLRHPASRRPEPGFDDSQWPVIGAKGLATLRGGGKVSFIWYRAKLTVPESRGLQSGGHHGGAHRERRRLHGNLGRRADVVPHRLP